MSVCLYVQHKMYHKSHCSDFLLPRGHFSLHELIFLCMNTASAIYNSDIQHLLDLSYAFLWNAIHLTDDCTRDFPRA